MFEDKDLRIPGPRPGIKLQNIQKSQQEFLVSWLSQDQLEINILGMEALTKTTYILILILI